MQTWIPRFSLLLATTCVTQAAIRLGAVLSWFLWKVTPHSSQVLHVLLHALDVVGDFGASDSQFIAATLRLFLNSRKEDRLMNLRSSNKLKLSWTSLIRSYGWSYQIITWHTRDHVYRLVQLRLVEECSLELFWPVQSRPWLQRKLASGLLVSCAAVLGVVAEGSPRTAVPETIRLLMVFIR